MRIIPSSIRRSRRLRLVVATAVAAGALSVASSGGAGTFTPIADCTLSITPAKANGTEEVTITAATTTTDGYASFDLLDGQGLLMNSYDGFTFDFLNQTLTADEWLSLYLGGTPGTYIINMYGFSTPRGPLLCTATVTLNVRDAPTFTTTSPLPAGQVGQPYTTQILGDPGDYPEATCAITGVIPPGLSYTPPAAGTTDTLDCGTLTGTPTVAGTYTVTGVITYQEPAKPVPTAETGPTVPETVTQDYTITIAEAPVVDTPRYTG